MDAENETEPSDAALLDAARAGDDAAFGKLWARHSGVARRAAGAITQTFDPDDVVSEAFTAILRALRAGKGPIDVFRPYLLATIRNVIAGWGRARREEASDAVDEKVDPRSADLELFAEADASLVMKALETLPERWREVLWLTEVEALQPAEAAGKLGMSANSTAALAYRAREGLRQAWIQAHVEPKAADAEHRWVLDHIGQHARNALSARNRARFDAHFSDCATCQRTFRLALESSASFTPVMLPLAVGVLAAAGVGALAEFASAPAAQASESVPPSGAHRATLRRRGRMRRRGVTAAAVVFGVALLGTCVAVAVTSSTGSETSAEIPEPMASPSAPSPAPTTSTPTTSTPPPASPSPTATPTPVPIETIEPAPVRPSPSTSAPPAATPPPADVVPDVRFAVTSIDTGGGLLAPVVTGVSGPGASVTVTVGAVSVMTSADSAGRWRTDPIPVRPGSYTVSAAADGASTTAGVATVSSPVVSVAQRADGAIVTVRGGANTMYRIAMGAGVELATTDDSGAATVPFGGTGSDVTVYAVSGDRTGPRTVIPLSAR